MKTVVIEKLESHGEGVAHLGTKPLFVPQALPGEEVVVDIVAEKEPWARGKVVQVKSPSPHRQTPFCPHFATCGGCQLQHMSYAEQLSFKRARIQEALGNEADVLPTLPSPLIQGYRNKMLLPYLATLGFWKMRSHEIVPIESCPVTAPLGNAIFSSVKQLLLDANIPGYDEGKREGVLRYVLIKLAVNNNQALVVFVVNEKMEALSLIAKKLMAAHPEIAGVVENFNKRPDNVILTKDWKTLAGTFTMQERIAGLEYTISAAAFFQVNPFQAPHLWEKALEFADLKREDRVLDAFSGVGALTLQIAGHVASVVGIECVEEAVNDARENARLNNICNAEFIFGAVENNLDRLHGFNKVFLNPPRKGCDEAVIRALGNLSPEKVIYLSCYPEGLAKDKALLLAQGFFLKRAVGVDMFPHTTHVETVAEFCRA